MKLIDCVQGTDTWRQLRSGLPTASRFDQILTPAQLKPSASYKGLLAHLIAEWWIGQPIEEPGSAFMERGRELEPEAIAWYEREYITPVTRVGLCVTDDGRAGCSPDGLVGDEGMIEVKCQSASEHMRWVLFPEHDAYILQRQGQLWVTGRKWCDLVIYHPTMPKIVRRHERDPEVIAAIEKHVGAFCDRLEEAKARLADQRAEYLAEVERAAMESDLPPMIS